MDWISSQRCTVGGTVAAFGREMGPAVFGWIFAAHQLGVGFMAVSAGVSRDALGTYGPAFLIAGALCIVAAAAFLLVRKPVAALA